jgi:hypothetical protein
MLLINLFGPPGAGKSTTRAEVFSLLKKAGVNCEEIYETAKKFTWEKRFLSLKSQAYLFGKQLRDTEVLDGQVDVAITDSPLLLTEFYGRKYTKYPDSFYTAVREISSGYNNVNFFLKRTRAYNPKGRNQTEEESDSIAVEMLQMLDGLGIDFISLTADKGVGEVIAKYVLEKLNDA